MSIFDKSTGSVELNFSTYFETKVEAVQFVEEISNLLGAGRTSITTIRPGRSAGYSVDIAITGSLDATQIRVCLNVLQST